MVRCEVRLRIRVARPMARGRKRLSVGPSSACTDSIRSSSPTSSWLCSALATADSSSFSHGLAAPRGVNARIARASTTSLPRMWSHTSRALRADVRTYLACARTRIPGSGRRRRSRLRGCASAASWVSLSIAAAAAFSLLPSGLVPSGVLASAATRRRLGFALASPVSAASAAASGSPVASAAALSTPVSSAAWPSASGAAFFARVRFGFGSGCSADLAAASTLESLASSATLSSSGLPFCGSWGFAGLIAPCPWSRARGRCASARTRRACGRPSTRTRTRARACARRARRWCGRPSRGRSSTPATRCGPSAWCWPCSCPRCAASGAPRRTGPSWTSGTSASTLLAAAPASDDVAVGRLALLAGAVADGRHAPRRLRMVAQRRGALTAAVRMVDRVHGRASRLRAYAHVALAAGLADRDVLVVGVADRADGGPALGAHHAHLAGRQAQRRVVALLRHQLDADTGGAAELAAAPGLELDVVDDLAHRHVGQRERVADHDVGARARLHRHADAQAVGGEDVALLAVAVVDQRDVGRAVRVVLDRGDPRGDAVLGALEVDLAI